MVKRFKRSNAVPSTDSPSVQLARFIAKFMPAMQGLTKTVLRQMRAQCPGALEMVYDNYNALVVGFCSSDRASDVICSIGVYPRWINLFFFAADTLPDPDGLLQGKGSIVRSITLRQPADLARPAVRALIREAIRRADPPLDTSAKRRLIIKSVSAKQRPRRPTHTQGGGFSPRRAVKREKVIPDP